MPPERAAPRSASIASLDLGALEEPLGAAQLVGDPGVGEGLLVDLGLGVDAVEHGDLAGRDAGGDQVPDPVGDALGLGGLVGVLGVDRVGAGLALRDQLEPVLGGPALGLVQQPVGQVDHLRGGAVVADQLDHGGLRVAGCGSSAGGRGWRR